MKSEEIDAMLPGSDLDTLVAERIMKYTSTARDGYPYWEDEECECVFPKTYFRPSTTIGDAWEVVEKMLERGFSFDGGSWENMADGNSWLAEFEHSSALEATCGLAPTMPLAICRAALKALEVKSED